MWASKTHTHAYKYISTPIAHWNWCVLFIVQPSVVFIANFVSSSSFSLWLHFHSYECFFFSLTSFIWLALCIRMFVYECVAFLLNSHAINIYKQSHWIKFWYWFGWNLAWNVLIELNTVCCLFVCVCLCEYIILYKQIKDTSLFIHNT